MSNQALLLELQALRQELAVLSSRVLALELASGTAPSSSGGAGTLVSVSYNPAGETSSAAPFVPSDSPAAAAPEIGSGTAVETPSEAERRDIATQVGQFLRRALDGRPRGTSGRDQVPLSSRYYVLCRDISGNCYNPVRVFKTFSALKPLVKEANGTCGDSVFIGFATIWEAQVAVRIAGLKWPERYE